MIPIDIVVLDYGVGNGNSVVSFLKSLGCHVTVSSDPQQIMLAKALFIPGVGAFSVGIENIKNRDLIDPLIEFKESNKLVVGICLGMQLFSDKSTEKGEHAGLGWIPGSVRHFDTLDGHGMVPHIGWNDVDWIKKTSAFRELDERDKFYFDHSYFYACEEQYVLAKTKNRDEFASAINRDNVYGFQFHPEKSQLSGKKLIVQLLDKYNIDRKPLCLLEES